MSHMEREAAESPDAVARFLERNGKTLANIQDEQSAPLDERLVMGWALQLCTVLHYLHTLTNEAVQML